MSEEIAVRPFNREALKQPISKVIVEVFPAPENTYLASWALDLAQTAPDEYSIAEIQALADACFAAGKQIQDILSAIDELEDDDDGI